MKIYIGSDHAGFKLKEKMKVFLEELGYKVEDCGNYKIVKDDDYPDYGVKVAEKVAKSNHFGVLVCGSSHGVCIVANKVRGIRAVAVNNLKDARLTREHNDANIICLSGWNTNVSKAKKILRIWSKAKFSGAIRHRRRISKIKKIEKKWFK